MVAAGSANGQRPKHQRDTRPRNGLMVLMVLMVLKELSCPPGFQTEPKFLANDTTKNEKREAITASLFRTRNRGRTGTGITAHRILSPACLPIPPSEPLSLRKDDANVVILFNSAKSYRQYTQLSDLPYLEQTT